MEILTFLTLEKGIFIQTKFGWEGIITEIDSNNFIHGQGISVIRVGDNSKLNIHPSDIAKLL